MVRVCCEFSGPCSSSCWCISRSCLDWSNFSRNNWPLIVPLLSFLVGPIVGTTGNRSPHADHAVLPHPAFSHAGSRPAPALAAARRLYGRHARHAVRDGLLGTS